ncbi:MAG: MarR family transcriptional regulator [Candidatus Hodarchaeales archaeon]
MSRENGLTQKEIASLIGKSKSSISRILELLVEQGFCNYILEDNEKARAERRYYVKGSFKELTIARTKKSLASNLSLKNDLQLLTENMTRVETNPSSSLLSKIEQFCDLIDILNLTQENTLEILQQHYKDVD